MTAIFFFTVLRCCKNADKQRRMSTKFLKIRVCPKKIWRQESINTHCTLLLLLLLLLLLQLQSWPWKCLLMKKSVQFISLCFFVRWKYSFSHFFSHFSGPGAKNKVVKRTEREFFSLYVPLTTFIRDRP